MIENEYSMFKGKLKDEEIANRLKKEYKIEISGVSSNFEVRKVDIEDGKFKLEINFNSFYFDSIFRIEANDKFTLYLK
jgi:acetolactate synthase small subunit